MIGADRSDADIRPFRIGMPQADLDDLQERSSRPCRAPATEEARICELRPRTGRSPRTIAVELGWPHSTVHQVAPRWQFAARAGRAVLRPGGERLEGKEVAVYRVRGGKVVEASFHQDDLDRRFWE